MSAKKIVVTGAAGQIAYALLFRIAAGELLGEHQKIVLSLVDLPATAKMLKAVRMELVDGAYPLLDGIEISHSMDQACEGAHIALLVGAKPRGPGMERGDLLEANGSIFIEQGKALRRAHPTLHVFVVGNPCNTNAWILTHAGRLNPKAVFAMTQLDLNRAYALVAETVKVSVADLGGIVIWGNHSATQVPDLGRASCQGKPLQGMDRDYRYGAFITEIAQRGAAVIAQRGSSSAASAAQAIIDMVQTTLSLKPSSALWSSAVHTADNPYGLDEDLFFSMPIRLKGAGDWDFDPAVASLPVDIESLILKSQQELLEERDRVAPLVKG